MIEAAGYSYSPVLLPAPAAGARRFRPPGSSARCRPRAYLVSSRARCAARSLHGQPIAQDAFDYIVGVAPLDRAASAQPLRVVWQMFVAPVLRFIGDWGYQYDRAMIMDLKVRHYSVPSVVGLSAIQSLGASHTPKPEGISLSCRMRSCAASRPARACRRHCAIFLRLRRSDRRQ